jgi:hypothetical protein
VLTGLIETSGLIETIRLMETSCIHAVAKEATYNTFADKDQNAILFFVLLLLARPAQMMATMSFGWS